MIKVSGLPATTSDYEIVTLATLKAFLGKTGLGTGDDTLMQLLLDNVHRAVFNILGGRILKDSSGTNYVYILDGTGTSALTLPQWPLGTITSVQHGYVSAAPTTFTVLATLASTDYYVDAENGRLWSRYWGFAEGRHNYKVEWRAGYATIPQDIQDGICQWVGVKLSRIKDGRLDKTTLTKETESASYTIDDAPERAMALIRTYRRVDLGIG